MTLLALFSLYWLVQAIQPLLVPICFVFAWAIVILLGWGLWTAIRDGVARAHQMHQIPCAECRFFTGDYHLKCPVHPTAALSDEAVNCPDYEAVSYVQAIGARSYSRGQ